MDLSVTGMAMQPSVKDRSELVCEPPSSTPWPNLPPPSDGDAHSIRLITNADRHGRRGDDNDGRTR